MQDFFSVDAPDMLNAGLHFGSKSDVWHPRMRKYIYGNSREHSRHVIDVVQGALCLRKAKRYLYEISRHNGTVLIVGTQHPMNSLVQRLEGKVAMHTIHTKWLGGMLTNWPTLARCVRMLNTLEILDKRGVLETLPPQEFLKIQKYMNRLQKYLSGIKYMPGLPWVVIILGNGSENGILNECNKLDITTVGVIDTNCDPDAFDMYVPCNHGSPKSLSWIVHQLMVSLKGGYLENSLSR